MPIALYSLLGQLWFNPVSHSTGLNPSLVDSARPSIDPTATRTAQASSPACSQFLGNWQEATPLPVPIESHAMVAAGNFLYVIGGWNQSDGARSQVYMAPLRADGTVGEWRETTAPLPQRLQHHTAVAAGDRIYIFGGDSGFGGTVSDAVFQAVPDVNGDIHNWTEIARLPAPLTLHGMTQVGDRIYTIGGVPRFDATQTDPLDSIYMAELSALSEPNPFQPVAQLPTATAWLTAAALDNRIYVLGGRSSLGSNQLSDRVWVAEVLADGQLSPFQMAGNLEARARHTTTAIGDGLLTIGGGGARNVLDRVRVTSPQADNRLDAWVSQTPLPEPRFGHAALARDNYLYVSGGFFQYGSFETRPTLWIAPICSPPN